MNCKIIRLIIIFGISSPVVSACVSALLTFPYPIPNTILAAGVEKEPVEGEGGEGEGQGGEATNE